MKKDFIEEAANEAKKALCLRDKCGAIIVLNEEIIGKGFNGPANGDADSQKCTLDLTESTKPKSDRTCCVHAEWRAIIDAIRNKKNIQGSSLYFSRVDDKGNILHSGPPYCTVCSRLALDTGIVNFVLLHDTGVRIYDTKEYNELSYQFHKKKLD